MIKEIVNLEKLNQINDSLATKDSDKKLLKDCYQQALNEINNLEKETKTLVDLAEKLNEITCLLGQIQCRCGISTRLEKPFMYSDTIDNIIDERKEILHEGLNELSKYDYHDIDSLLARLSDNIYILNRDLSKKYTENNNQPTLRCLDNNELFSANSNRLLFNNEDFYNIILECYNIIQSDFTKEAIIFIYPTLLEDFDNFINQIKEQTRKLGDIRNNYISLLNNITHIYNKYRPYSIAQFSYK